MTNTKQRDARYRELVLEPLRSCSTYMPSMGRAEPISLKQFSRLFREDPLYQWVGLDSPLMYAAHKAAGGMTSIYRQLGTGCERLVRAIMKDEFGLSDDQINWSYTIQKEDGSSKTLTLDARLDYDHLSDVDELNNWTTAAARKLGFSQKQTRMLNGSVFEIRQGYKSRDAKRQNADMQSAIRARNDGYVFSMAVLSTQISESLRRRYQNSQMLVLVGNLSGDPLDDTYAFIEQVIGYPITKFFERNSESIRSEVDLILRQLLSPS